MALTRWILDPVHSEVTFKIKHLMITNVTGEFDKYDIQVETEGEDFMKAKVVFTAEIDSVSTNNEQRDGHLKSDDFFNAEQYPQLKFVPNKYEAVDKDGSYEVYGDLTIRGITRPEKFDVEFGGVITDPWGNTRAGFSINGKINRKDFDLKWNAITETGGLVVSDDVQIHVNIELLEQKG